MTYFTLDEFACKHCGKNLIHSSFVDRLDRARGLAGIPFVINSGYRCDEHDKSIGGKGNHPSGYAADIMAASSKQRFKILQALLAVGFNRIGIGETFIHVDCNPEKPSGVIWSY